MKEKNGLYRRILLTFALALICSGCGRTPESRLILLPEPEQEQDEGQAGEGCYTVQKIYSREYERLFYSMNQVSLQENERHGIRYFKREGEVTQEVRLDYRYGFYETGKVIANKAVEELYLYGGNVTGQEPENQFSPDGQWFFWKEREVGEAGEKLLLLNLQTGEQRLLLDGNGVGCPADEWQILAGWDTDSSLFCYGFCPRSRDIWDSRDTEDPDSYRMDFLDLKTGEGLPPAYPSYGELGIFRDPKEKRIRVYADREEERLLLALAQTEPEEKPVSDSVACVFELRLSGGESQEMPCSFETLYEERAGICLDAEANLCCIALKEEGERLLFLDTGTGDLKNFLHLPVNTEVRRILLLDGAAAAVTAEFDMQTEENSLCLYQLDTGGGRQVLYRGLGFVFRLQYDPVFRRLLADAGSEIYERQACELYLKGQALILEFGE